MIELLALLLGGVLSSAAGFLVILTVHFHVEEDLLSDAFPAHFSLLCAFAGFCLSFVFLLSGTHTALWQIAAWPALLIGAAAIVVALFVFANELLHAARSAAHRTYRGTKIRCRRAFFALLRAVRKIKRMAQKTMG